MKNVMTAVLIIMVAATLSSCAADSGSIPGNSWMQEQRAKVEISKQKNNVTRFPDETEKAIYDRVMLNDWTENYEGEDKKKLGRCFAGGIVGYVQSHSSDELFEMGGGDWTKVIKAIQHEVYPGCVEQVKSHEDKLSISYFTKFHSAHPSNYAETVPPTELEKAEDLVNLGVKYHKGKGVPLNKIKAYELYLQAARQGNENAQRNLDILCKDSPWACK